MLDVGVKVGYLGATSLKTSSIKEDIAKRALRALRRKSQVCLLCGGDRDEGSVYCLRHHEVMKLRAVQKNLKYKTDCINHYGGKCICCGETELVFLCIDHINGGGVAHRKEIGMKIHRWLRQKGYPAGYQVLCANCNLGKMILGICPHQL